MKEIKESAFGTGCAKMREAIISVISFISAGLNKYCRNEGKCLQHGLRVINYSVDAVFKNVVCIEVYKYANFQTCQPEIRFGLFPEDVLHFLDTLQFNNHPALY